MILDSGLGVRLLSRDVPILPETLNYASMGLLPAGAYKNREFRECMVDFSPSVDHLMQDALFDPQTSGGLLICIAPDRADALLEALEKKGIKQAAIIGDVIPEPRERIVVE